MFHVFSWLIWYYGLGGEYHRGEVTFLYQRVWSNILFGGGTWTPV